MRSDLRRDGGRHGRRADARLALILMLAATGCGSSSGGSSGAGGTGGRGGVGDAGAGGATTGSGGVPADGGAPDGGSGDAGTGYMPCPTTAGTACAVLPLGDSITEGYLPSGANGGYRVELFRQ